MSGRHTHVFYRIYPPHPFACPSSVLATAINTNKYDLVQGDIMVRLEVTQLSKTEKATEKGIVMVHKATLKGSGFVKSPVTGDSGEVLIKVLLECEDPTLLENFISQRIGDERTLSIAPVNRTLDKFVVAGTAE